MKNKRRLALNSERLLDLTQDQLQAAGGNGSGAACIADIRYPATLVCVSGAYTGCVCVSVSVCGVSRCGDC